MAALLPSVVVSLSAAYGADSVLALCVARVLRRSQAERCAAACGVAEAALLGRVLCAVDGACVLGVVDECCWRAP